MHYHQNGFHKKTFVTKSPEVLLNLYKTLVHPHLEYCISVWSPHYQKDKKNLSKRYSTDLPQWHLAFAHYSMKTDFENWDYGH